MRRITANGLTYYQFEMWSEVPFQHAIVTRLGGVSPAPWGSLNLGGTVGDAPQAVAQNHRLMYDALEVDRSQACTVWQVHGADTVVVNYPPQGRKWINRADGMVSNQAGLPLVMRYADCTPILYYDPAHQAVGIAHAGWRGTLDGAQVSVVDAMQESFETNPAELQVGIGPSIGPDHYQVGEEVVAQVQQVFGHTDGVIRRANDGSAYFNLWEANRRLLQQAGVTQIEVAEICTFERTDEFFSHRGEKGKTGRFGGLIAL